MPTTANHAIWTPASESNYNLTTDLASMAASIDTAMVKSANAYKGTAAQRAAFTAAPVGALWVDTNGTQQLWVMRIAGWEQMYPAPASASASTDLLSYYNSSVASGTSLTAVGWGPIVSISGVFSLATAIAVGATGDITNQKVVNALPTAWRPIQPSALGSGTSGRLASFTIDTSGTISITAVAGSNANLAVGNPLSFNGTYLRAATTW